MCVCVEMPSLSNSVVNLSGTTTTAIALSIIATVSAYYLFHDKRFTLSERLYYLICKRNIQEALLEHEIIQEGKRKKKAIGFNVIY